MIEDFFQHENVVLVRREDDYKDFVVQLIFLHKQHLVHEQFDQLIVDEIFHLLYELSTINR